MKLAPISGFTLIELLVVIAIIGLLSSIVLVSLKGAKDRARISRVKSEMNHIESAIDVARYGEKEVLMNVTGSGCSDCACRNGEDLSAISNSHSCIKNWRNAFNEIGIEPIRDPWGSPYLIDENELEFSGNPCRSDSLSSAGPDRKFGTSDDFGILINFYSSQCSE